MRSRLVRSIASTVAATALIVGGATVASAATTVTVSAPAFYSPGGSVTAKITAQGTSARSASLQVKSGSKWTAASRTIALSKGKGSTTLKPSVVRTYRIKVGSAYSKPFTVTPVTISATLAKPTITKGSSTTVSIAVSPKVSGTAKLQVKSGSSWTTASRAIAVKSGKASTTVAPSATRTYRIILGSAVSPALTVKVESAAVAPASFTVTGSGWGHGVGMSQYGAYGMALDGSDAAAILTHYYTGTQLESVAANPDIRVQVFGKGSDSTSAVKLIVRSPGTGTNANGAWRMTFAATEGGAPAITWTGYNNEVLTVSRAGSQLKITRDGTSTTTTSDDGASASGAVVALQWEATSYFSSDSPENPYVELQTSSGAAATHGQYRHGELVLTSTGSRINVVNVLKLDTEYLLGVAEMPSSWSAEALKAQAITARGYAVRAVTSGVGSSCGCNLYDDASSQNFSGWKKESEGTDAYYGKRWVAAVLATQSDDGSTGQVLTYSPGKIATTYYFSSSGGQTENSEQVWSSSIAYLRSVNDPWSLVAAVKNPNASWSATVSQATMKAAFGLPDVVKVVVSARTSSSNTAAAYKVTATSSSGSTATITGADKIRIALGVKSPWIRTIAAN